MGVAIFWTTIFFYNHGNSFDGLDFNVGVKGDLSEVPSLMARRGNRAAIFVLLGGVVLPCIGTSDMPIDGGG